MELPYTLEKLREATHELIRVNKLRSCYIRPVAFRGYGEMGLFPLNAPVDVFIAVWPWGAYLGEEGQKHGIRCKVVVLAADVRRRASSRRRRPAAST